VSPRQRETQKLVAIEKRSAQFLILLLLASLWFQSWSISLGLILGGGVAILNFRWLWRIMEKVLFEQKKFYGIQALMKFILLVVVVLFVLRYLAVNPIAFLAGISTLVVGILFEVIRESFRSERKGNI
jgi:steroid 5-alpha reductase family enzyme